MALPAIKGPTYADIESLPENMVGEIVDGELYASPRPAGPHATGSSALGGVLIPPMQFGRGGGSGGWWILDEPELHLAQNVLVPDLAGWRRERLPHTREAHFTIAPDWVCEVLSPSTSRLDRTRKLPFYARVGVPHLWLLDPLAETLEVYRLSSEHWMLLGAYGADDVLRAEPFHEVEVELKLLWGR